MIQQDLNIRAALNRAPLSKYPKGPGTPAGNDRDPA